MNDKEILGLIMEEKLLSFMWDSNAIEGEHGNNPNDLKAAKMALALDPRKLEPKEILAVHKIVAAHEPYTMPGKWRDCQVYVGKHIPPPPNKVPKLMLEFCNRWPTMDAWEAHNAFVDVHPMRDFNGRLSRLLALAKMYNSEGYNFGLPWLHWYYYQTLSHIQKV